MEELVILIFELLLEPVANLLGNFLPQRRDAAPRPEFVNIAIALCGGFALGALTIALYPHFVVKQAFLKGVVLIVGPIFAGWMMQRLGERRMAAGRKRGVLNHFGRAYALAAGLTLARFLGAH